MTDEYKFGNCTFCNKHKPLKNNICIDCNKSTKANNWDLPDFMKDIFNGGKSK